MHSATGTAHRGFTLIELSIVLVIIGLIVGGVLAGQELIRSAEIKSVYTDVTRFHTAINTFRGKYNALPGDMADATNYWGTNPGCGTPGTPGTGTQTCNGNGDGMIGVSNQGGPQPYTQWQEMLLAWQHLANAGMVSGAYTGVADVDFHHVPGVNCPSSKLGATTGYAIMFAMIPPSGWYPGSFGQLIEFGAQQTDYEPYDPVFTPAEQHGFDLKWDDGLPGTGNIMSTQGTCVTSTDPAVAQYNTSFGGKACRTLFLLHL